MQKDILETWINSKKTCIESLWPDGQPHNTYEMNCKVHDFSLSTWKTGFLHADFELKRVDGDHEHTTPSLKVTLNGEFDEHLMKIPWKVSIEGSEKEELYFDYISDKVKFWVCLFLSEMNPQP
jgi:hypothetical protein